MDLFTKTGTTLKKRASLSFRLGLQKPTFATLNEEPTRYYDFVDTPVLFRPSSPLIERQEISPELESNIRYACSLLVYRIEQGVPSPHRHRPATAMSPRGSVEDLRIKAQLESKYLAPKVGPEVAARKGKYDSGVVLTQQPSIQTMRALHSRSGEPSESEDNRTGSVFSNSRTGTSCSSTNTSYSPGRSWTSPAVSSPKQNAMLSMTGGNVMGCVQQENYDTKAFLSSSLKSEASPEDDSVSEDIEVFLDADTSTDEDGAPLFSSPQALNNASPSLGITKDPKSKRQSTLRDQPTESSIQESNLIGLGASGLEQSINPPSIIIDSRGRTHILTAEEETQRLEDLQQAVMAKMETGLIKSNPIRHPLPSQCENAKDQNGTNSRPRSSAFRLKSSWPAKTSNKTAPFNQKVQFQQTITTTTAAQQSVFKKLASFFFSERNTPPCAGE
ncbi:hypothetical protein ARAM_002961 [Aspergillus rambellii]|uniref:Uncharacterized protein n=1 Tax=Aspergillus rambellii TaxID=308745 RepID=A0A0F8V455_9EURO|nr:hypothetical protein ARAM_002961 [Aspergillus rambellii]